MNNKYMKNTRLRGADFSYRYFHLCVIFIFLLVFVSIIGFTVESFASAYNIRNIIESAFPLMMVAFGQMLVILTGGIDLSVGGMLTLGNCICVAIMTRIEGPFGVFIAVVTTIIACMLCGAFNGLFIAKARLPAIIVTIASSTIFEGLALLVMPLPGGKVNAGFAKLLNGKFFKLPVAFYIAVIFVILMTLLTNKTPFGKAIRAIGGNESAAYGTGVPVAKTKFYTYVLAGFFCAIGGLYLSARMYSADPNIGTTYSVYSITATVVGGTLMTGAIGEAIGTVCGVFIIYIINNVLNLMGVYTYYQYAFQGLVLIFALVIGSLESKRH